MSAPPFVAAMVFVAAAAFADGDARRPREAYRAVVEEDGRVLRERAATLRALRADRALLERHAALVDSLSAHVNRARPQVIDDFRDRAHRIEIPPAPALDYTDAFSYGLWVFLEAPDMVRETKIVSHAGVANGKVTLTGDGRRLALQLRYADGSTLHVRTVAGLEPYRWTHVGVSFERRRGAALWIDGAPAAVRVLKGAPAARGPLLSLPGQEIYVGGLDRAFPGRIDDLRIYGRALDEREFRRLAAGEAVAKGLVAHWPLDDTTRVARDRGPHRVDGAVGEGVRLGRPGRIGTAAGFARDRAAWTLALEGFESAIARAEHEAKSRDRRSPAPSATLAELCARLAAENAVLVHYAGGAAPGAIVAWIVDPRADEAVTRRELRLPDGFDASRDALLAELHTPPAPGASDTRAREAGRELARALWDPIEDAIDAGCDVWLRVPPRLREIPFACLVGRDGAWLAERRAFAYCGPVRALTRHGTTRFVARDGAAGRAVAIANPSPHALEAGGADGAPHRAVVKDRMRGAGDDVAPCAVTGTPLYGTRVEAEAIAPVLRGAGYAAVEIHDWAGAQEARVAEIVRGASVVHVATHGYRIDASCLPAAPRDPLYLSGVVLAGAMRLVPDHERGGDEGLLSAAEVAEMDFSSAGLVVWSGCATAVGDALAGEPMSGLAAAAWLAGARASIATRWRVSDEDMPGQVRAFYRAWAGGASPARAARAAQLAVIESARRAGTAAHPARWAALTVEGL